MTEAPAGSRTRGATGGVDAQRGCPACGGEVPLVFYEQARVPVDSLRVLDDRAEAEAFPHGSLRLGCCERCGFVWNTTFDPAAQDNSASFQESQWFSPRFQDFGQAVASRLVERYDLRGRDLLEIGCGPGDFLALMCELGSNRGIGIDPCAETEPAAAGASSRVTFIQDYFSERYADLTGDLVICRHVLEHIQPVRDFLRLIRRSLEGREETVLFLEVPDMTRILRKTAFWQIYYEHCSYFTPGSLARLLRSVGFEIVDLSLDFDSQYILAECRPAVNGDSSAPFAIEEEPLEVARAASEFGDRLSHLRATWQRTVATAQGAGKRVVLWGGAPNAAAFTLALGLRAGLDHIVNINPAQQGMFAVGTGQEIVAPESLRDHQPVLVILMNQIYEAEVGEMLRSLGVQAELVSV